MDLSPRIGPGQLPVRLTRADRQRDRERRAAVRVVGSPDFAAVALDDGATDRQPDPQAVALARDEGVEDGLEISRAIPVPLSCSSTRTFEASIDFVRTIRRRAPLSWASPMALKALSIRFSITCWS